MAERSADDLPRTLGIVGVTVGLQAIHSLNVLAVPVMLPAAAMELGVEGRFAGNFTAIAYGSCMVISIALASSISRIGAFTLCVIATVVAGIGIGIFAGGSVAWMILAAVVLGFGYGPITPATAGLLAGRVPPRWFGLVFSLKQTGVPIGFATAGVVVPFLVGHLGWKGGALALTGAMFATAMLLLPLRRRFDGERTPAAVGRVGRLAPFGLVLRQRQLRALSLGSVLFLVPQSCLGSFLVVYLVEQGELSLAVAGGLLAVAQGAGMISRISCGAIADRIAERFSLLAVLGACSTAGAIATALMSGEWSYSLAALTCVVYGAGAIGWNGVMLAELARWSPPGQAAAVAGASSAITYAGAVVGPAGFGLLVGAFGYQAGFFGVAAIAVIAASWFAIEGLHLRRTLRKSEHFA